MINTPSQRFSSHNYYTESSSDDCYNRNDLESVMTHQVFDGAIEYVWTEQGIFSVKGWDDDLDLTELDEDESKEAYFILVKDMLEKNDNEFILHKGSINEYWLANFQISEETIKKVSWDEELCEHEFEEATLKECEWVLGQAIKSIEMVKKWNEGK